MPKMDNPHDGGWLGPLITAGIALVGAAYALLRKLFSTVSQEKFDEVMERARVERTEQFDKLEAKMDRLHAQNTARLDQLLERRRNPGR